MYSAVLSHSVVSDSLQPPWTVARQAPRSMWNLQARILKWVAISFSRGSSNPRDRTWVFGPQADSLPTKLQGKSNKMASQFQLGFLLLSTLTFFVFWVFLAAPHGLWASLVAQLVKNPPAMQEIPVQFLGWEDLLEKT